MIEIRTLRGHSEWESERSQDLDEKLNEYLTKGWNIEKLPTFSDNIWYAVISREKE